MIQLESSSSLALTEVTMHLYCKTVLLGLLSATACSAAAPDSSRPNARDQGSARPTLTIADGDRVTPANCKGSWVVGATGRVQDDAGNAIADMNVGFCVFAGTSSTCLAPGTTGSQGWFSYQIPAKFRCMENLIIRTSAPPFGSQRYAESYCKPALTPREGALEIELPQVLHALDAPMSLPPIGDPTLAHQVAFANGVEITLVPNDMAEGDLYPRLGSKVLNPKASHCFVPSGLALDGLIAFGPSMNVNVGSGAPKMDFRLKTSLPEGSAVDLYILGGVGTQLDVTHGIEEGVFAKVGSGNVTAGSVRPDANSRLPALTVVGYKRKG
jgi:hypothetical protein